MKPYIISALLFSISFTAFSNNIAISNVTIASRNTVDNYIMVQFDLAWDNSWRTSSGPSNWDAAWVFVKFKIKGQDVWNHASLNWGDGTGSGDGHIVPPGAIIKGDIDTGDGNSSGVFIYSAVDKIQGPASYSGVQLRWQYGEDAVQDNDLVEICVFGIEMVYVPEAAFQVGTAAEGFAAFYTHPDVQNPYTISDEGAILVGNADGRLNYGVDGGDGLSIPATFPKGYSAFYCMKYEITQEQYVEFLLKLTSTQAASRAYTSGGFRNQIEGTYGTFKTGLKYVACNFLSWADLVAYLDWAALRPMTELEYEKACRGTVLSIPSEYAWGTTEASLATYTLEQTDTENEGVSTDNYNISAGNVNNAFTEGLTNGPMRVGIFAANSKNTGRITSGATYYGIMEMSGNVIEQTVTVGNAAGRAFRNIHGDGQLNINGEHNASSWPGVGADGAGIRGGGWSINPPFGHVSNRLFAISGASNRQAHVGGRGVRIAP